MNRYFFTTCLLLIVFTVYGQPERWQQRVNYKMKIDVDVKTHRYDGEQTLQYWNNSSDTLYKVFYHLYFNAFQPNSMMDVRSRTIADADRRVADRISKLQDHEIGFQRIDELKQNGKPVRYEVVGTILEVTLNEPIMPRKRARFDMKWQAQVPLQIRRSGRDSDEGIAYSMAQWYPKMCQYDYQGWHANPYIAREFYGIWGDYEVEIKIDDSYIVAAGGELLNARDVGRGYSDKVVKPRGRKETWKYRARNVHDFMWAADPDYVVDQYEFYDGTKGFFVYQPGEITTPNWKQLPKIMDAALKFMNRRYGKYPYPVYYFIQGGDGGMEYPMGTLITGVRPLSSLVGVSVHEWMHSWYQMVLATNESLYGWMDEGFTSFASAEVMNHLRVEKLLPGEPVSNPLINSVQGYVRFNATGLDEPLSTHADHFNTNQAYSVAAYVKGAVCLVQLEYIMGKAAFDRALLRYYNTWKFKHPNSIDFLRVMEKESGLELDWFHAYFVYSTHMPDYGIAAVNSLNARTQVILNKIGRMPMPLDVVVTYRDGTKSFVNIPLEMMRGQKPREHADMQYILGKDWPWTHPEYQFELDMPLDQIERIEIDPSLRMMDSDRSNNVWDNTSE